MLVGFRQGTQGLSPRAQQDEMGVLIQATTQVKKKQLKSKIPSKKLVFYPKVTIA